MDFFRGFLLSARSTYRLPVFAAKRVRILGSPEEFYAELKARIRTARRRVSLASLYIGTGDLERELVSALEVAVTEHPGLKVNIVVDRNRGTRPDREGNSTATLCASLVLEKNAQLSLFKMPRDPQASRARLFLESYLPPRFNEMFQTFHLKAYAFDDSVVLSGANLSTDYFTNRQDRYIVVECPPLARFYHNVCDILSRYSMAHAQVMEAPGHEKPDYASLKSELESALIVEDDLVPHDSDFAERAETLVVPTLQLKALGIDVDENVTLGLLHGIKERFHAGEESEIFVASGYLNFTDDYIDALRTAGARTNVVTASPEANGFYNALGAPGAIPLGYSMLQSRFMAAFNSYRRNEGTEKGETARCERDVCMFEYNRPGWTFHGKGFWYTSGTAEDARPSGTIVGSSNFGWRSVLRDMESSVLLHTTNAELQEAMLEEWQSMIAGCTQVDESIFQTKRRQTTEWFSWTQGHWIRPASHLITKFM